MQPTLRPLDLRTQLESLVDDTYDADFEYQLLTQAKDDLETKMKLLILQTMDQSQTANPGDTYLTLKSLPVDCKEVSKIMVGTVQYFPIRYDQQIRYRNTPRRFFVDYKKLIQGLPCLALTGAVATAQTITVYYRISTPKLTQLNENEPGVVLWPDEFARILPYHAAKILQANVDADETNFRMSAMQEVEYQNLMDGFVAWDADMKLAQMGGAGGYADEYDESPFPENIGLL